MSSAVKKPFMAFDSSAHFENATGQRLPFRREGCRIVLPRSSGLAADTSLAEDVIARTSPRQTAEEAADFLRRFPNANRLK